MKTNLRSRLRVWVLYPLTGSLLCGVGSPDPFAQETPAKPTAEPTRQHIEKADKLEKAANPAQIELLETRVRFETNGDSRKEVHALVKIHSELGVRQFAQLNFDFNRSFESVGIPLAAEVDWFSRRTLRDHFAVQNALVCPCGECATWN